MKTKSTIILFVMVLTATIFALPALADDEDQVQTKAKLEALVDEFIDSCDAKSELLGSRSENIRRSARISCMKASYCRHNKAELIQDMLDQKIEAKPYKVRLFVSEKFKRDSMMTGLAGN